MGQSAGSVQICDFQSKVHFYLFTRPRRCIVSLVRWIVTDRLWKVMRTIDKVIHSSLVILNSVVDHASYHSSSWLLATNTIERSSSALHSTMVVFTIVIRLLPSRLLLKKNEEQILCPQVHHWATGLSMWYRILHSLGRLVLQFYWLVEYFIGPCGCCINTDIVFTKTANKNEHKAIIYISHLTGPLLLVVL